MITAFLPVASLCRAMSSVQSMSSVPITETLQSIEEVGGVRETVSLDYKYKRGKIFL